jgi:hypothetical protein
VYWKVFFKINDYLLISRKYIQAVVIVPAESKMSHVIVTGDVNPTGEFLWSEDIGFQVVLLPKK